MYKPILNIILIFALAIGISYAEDVTPTKVDPRILKTWHQFLIAVSKDDTTQLKEISLGKIRCPLCLENTAKEYEDFKNFLGSHPNWYEELYSKKVYIPINKFCEEDVPIIFTENFVQTLKQNETFFSAKQLKGKKVYEILVTTTLPGIIAPNHEGGQHVFQFTLTDKIYKFSGLETVP